MDFSGRRLSNDSVILANIIMDICKLQPDDVENDGIVFHTEQTQHMIIKEDLSMKVCALQFLAHLVT